MDTGTPVEWSELYGTRLDPSIPLPEFSGVLDSTGASVTQDQLLGHPTVLWFYPAAGTYG